MAEVKVKRMESYFWGGEALRVFLAVILAGAVSVLLLLLTAVVLTVTNLSAETTGPLIGFVTYFSILLAGVLSGRGARKMGWLRGAFAGSLYLFIVRILGWLTMGAGSLGALLVALLPGILVGAVGGIIGINLFRRKK